MGSWVWDVSPGRPTLSRVLDRMMKAYSLGDWKDAVSAHEKVSPENIVLQKLISGTSGMNGPHEDGKTDGKNRRVLSHL